MTNGQEAGALVAVGERMAQRDAAQQHRRLLERPGMCLDTPEGLERRADRMLDGTFGADRARTPTEVGDRKDVEVGRCRRQEPDPLECRGSIGRGEVNGLSECQFQSVEQIAQ